MHRNTGCALAVVAGVAVWVLVAFVIVLTLVRI
jgi:hypothetical protein